MLLSTAVKLIENGIAQNRSPQTWADLGAGTGLFTKALATLLPNESTIVAVDKDEVALASIEIEKSVSLRTMVCNFEDVSMLPSNLDGILMANALHYVAHQKNCLTELRSGLKANGRLVLIEYDLPTANRWVTYPITKSKIEQLIFDAGYSSVHFLFETPSSFNRSTIYSCVVLK